MAGRLSGRWALATASAQADIFVNNAGVLTYAPLVELNPAQVHAMFNVNVLASIRISQLVGAAMAARGHGHIVVMTSLSARNINRLWRCTAPPSTPCLALPKACASSSKGRASR